MSSLTVSSEESSNLCILGIILCWLLFGAYRIWVLEVFRFAVYRALHCFLVEVLTLWLDDDVSMYKVVELVSMIPTRRKSSNSEFRVKRYLHFGIRICGELPVFEGFLS